MSLLSYPLAFAHRSGCHRWHTCPSDHGTYSSGISSSIPADVPTQQTVIVPEKTPASHDDYEHWRQEWFAYEREISTWCTQQGQQTRQGCLREEMGKHGVSPAFFANLRTKQPAQRQEMSAASFVGDQRDKRYYWPECAGYSQVAKSSRMLFSTKEAAEKAGYRPADPC